MSPSQSGVLGKREAARVGAFDLMEEYRQGVIPCPRHRRALRLCRAALAAALHSEQAAFRCRGPGCFPVASLVSEICRGGHGFSLGDSYELAHRG